MQQTSRATSGVGSTSQRVNSQSANVNVTTATPEQAKAILLADGWHEIDNCELTQFAIGEGMSPPQVSKTYPSISFVDKETNKQSIVPLRNVLGWEFEETYQNRSSSQSQSQSSR